MGFFNKGQIDKIISIAFEAGKIALKYHNAQNFEISRKLDDSEVTTADLEISQYINQELSKNFAQIPIICEEGNLRNFEQNIFWLIDPIDGTSSFIAKSDEFAINIALIKDNLPIFGLIYAPVFKGGKMILTDENNNLIIVDKNLQKKPLNKKENTSSNLRIVTSKKSKDSDITNYIKQFHPQFLDKFVSHKISSAVKFLLLVENEVDLYITLRPTMEWDTAAGQALIKFSNGMLKILALENSTYKIGEEMLYKKADFVNNYFVSSINYL